MRRTQDFGIFSRRRRGLCVAALVFLALAARPGPGAATPADALERILSLPALDAPARGEAEPPFAGPTLIHVFATWCEPCRAEMAPLARLALRLRGRLRVVVVNVGEPESRVRRFFAQDVFAGALSGGPPFPVRLDEARALLKPLGIEALPSSLLVDAEGRALLRAAGPVDWDSPQAAAALDAAARNAGRSPEKPAAQIPLPPLLVEETPQ